MKSIHVVLLVSGLIACASQAQARTILPDACGDDEVNFGVKTEKNQPAPAPPADGKAQIVFIESWVKNMTNIGGAPVVRYGMDGAWVGANKGDSYFTLTVGPGVHHLCASLQTISGKLKKNSIGVTSFTADAGRTYYYQFTFTQTGNMTMGASGPGVTDSGGGMNMNLSFNFAAASDDEGKYRVKSSALSTSKPGK